MQLLTVEDPADFDDALHEASADDGHALADEWGEVKPLFPACLHWTWLYEAGPCSVHTMLAA